MAKIELHVTAEDAADFYNTIAALARAPAGGQILEVRAAPVSVEDPTPAAPETAEAKRTRRTKAQIEADNAAATSQTTESPVVLETPAANTSLPASAATDEPEVTLDDINKKMTALMSAQPGCTAKIQEIVRQATDGKHGSPKQAMLAGDQRYFPVIMEGLNAL